MTMVERIFRRSKKRRHAFFAGVALNKGNTVIIGRPYNGGLLIVMEDNIHYTSNG
ncbi:hypothetical protein J2S06_001135 [Bacillus alveayuensis]|uniref:Uncharacterized protein n=1 Tax=Aeribacillus alveayuensis TaxID=279215 RepID=A0ABT9VM66_9BACI|nr:hypothetical protein [Bacillus alveayuensis]